MIWCNMIWSDLIWWDDKGWTSVCLMVDGAGQAGTRRYDTSRPWRPWGMAATNLFIPGAMMAMAAYGGFPCISSASSRNFHKLQPALGGWFCVGHGDFVQFLFFPQGQRWRLVTPTDSSFRSLVHRPQIKSMPRSWCQSLGTYHMRLVMSGAFSGLGRVNQNWLNWIFLLVGGLEHGFYFPIQLGVSSSQLTNSYFSGG